MRQRKEATESGRIKRPKQNTTTAGESVHDAETGSKAREPRDNRRTRQGAAVARRFAREGAAFVARTCPTKSTVVQPHLSALSCAPITCTAALAPRAKERANLMPLSTREYASSAHELATRSSSEGTMDTHSPRGGSAPPVCFGNETNHRRPTSRSARSAARLGTWQGTPVPCALHTDCTSTPTTRHAPRRSGRGSCQRPAHVHVRAERRLRGDDRTERAGGSDGRKGSGLE